MAVTSRCRLGELFVGELTALAPPWWHWPMATGGGSTSHTNASAEATEPVVAADELVQWLRELTPEEFLARGLSVEGTFDEVDDPVLIGPDGRPVETWREGYPISERLGRREYEHTKRLLQIELLKAQAWIKETGQRLVVVFEGRDAAGKGGTIKRFTEHLNPSGCAGRCVGRALGAGTRPVVLPAVPVVAADGRGDHLVRSILVQPGRRRACDGVLRV